MKALKISTLKKGTFFSQSKLIPSNSENLDMLQNIVTKLNNLPTCKLLQHKVEEVEISLQQSFDLFYDKPKNDRWTFQKETVANLGLLLANDLKKCNELTVEIDGKKHFFKALDLKFNEEEVLLKLSGTELCIFRFYYQKFILYTATEKNVSYQSKIIDYK